MSDPTYDHNAALVHLKSQRDGSRVIAGVAAALGIIAILGWALLLVKISQTSAYALQYSGRVHEQLGLWALGAGAITLIAIVLGIAAFRAIEQARHMKEEMVANLRQRLAAPIDASERSAIESQLRELGA
ncbi:hypothetical protein [Amorphus sp. MBR-141]